MSKLLEKIEADKEILSTMPKNNKKNIAKYILTWKHTYVFKCFGEEWNAYDWVFLGFIFKVKSKIGGVSVKKLYFLLVFMCLIILVACQNEKLAKTEFDKPVISDNMINPYRSKAVYFSSLADL